jgi:hypothetical protein
MTKSPSTILIQLNGVDITDRVVFSQTMFTSQANPMQGSFKVVVRDPDQDFSPVAGQKLSCHIDGVPLFGGYLMRIGRGNFFPAADTATPSEVRSRKWTLEGPDFNVIFDKRVMYKASDFAAKLSVPSGKRTITKAFKYMMNNFIDVPSGLNYSTYVDTIYDEIEGGEAAFGGDQGSSLLAQSTTWRKQMEDFADHSGIIYYIDADFKLHLHAYETVLSDWTMTDYKAGGSTVRFNSGEYGEDFTRVTTEALVWGGSSYKVSDGGTGGDIVFKKYPDYPISSPREQRAMDRLDTYGRWQMGEEHVGQDNYLTQKSVRVRARVIIDGPTGAVPTHGLEGGFSRPLKRMSCTWYAHDVPNGDHVRPGYMMDFILYSQGSGGNPLIFRLPMRSMSVTFPTKPETANETYVQFQGDYGVAYSDRRYLWKWLRRNRASITSVSSAAYASLADNNSTSVVTGTKATVYPLETANGSLQYFTLPFTFFEDQIELYINGLYQRLNIDYTYSATTGQLYLVTPPRTGDQLYAVGYVSQ